MHVHVYMCTLFNVTRTHTQATRVNDVSGEKSGGERERVRTTDLWRVELIFTVPFPTTETKRSNTLRILFHAHNTSEVCVSASQ